MLRRRSRSFATATLAAVALLSLGACDGLAFQPEPETTAPAPTDPPGDRTTLTTQLSALSIEPRRLRDDYERSAFGSAWRDVDGNGCNQRDDVLLRDAVPGSTRLQQQGRCPHDVLAGTWVDPYTGRTLTLTDLKQPSQAQAVQIDHVVPLAEAWSSGAHAWDDDRRARYANDLSGLLAVDGPTNASKGSADPASWRPRKAYQCSYAERWITTKHRWKLAADASEVRALREMLALC